ncbi:MAG: mercury resistance system transport protein MerF [Gemmatimonadetes bacterium]|nr:mercury resistance system transport protein MerF [Gemmatimonadota bacterium]
MEDKTLLRTGLAGSNLLALCCATPVLVVVLGAVGLAAWTTHLDAVLIPALGFFVVLSAIAYWRVCRGDPNCRVPNAPPQESDK